MQPSLRESVLRSLHLDVETIWILTEHGFLEIHVQNIHTASTIIGNQMITKGKPSLEITSDTVSQEIFDFVVDSLRMQGAQSIDEDGTCSYRGLDHKKCAVGWVVPDDLYDESMEGASVHELLINCDYEDSLYYISDFIRPHELLLCDLQAFHDDRQNWNDSGVSDAGHLMLRRIAAEHNLRSK